MKRTACALAAMLTSAAALEWSQLPPLPDREGFAGAFAGVSHGALLVAGGANIASDKWAEVFHKTCYDSVFVLDRPEAAWRAAGKLPRALGYGVSITMPNGFICIGGSDAERHHAEVFRVEWREGRLAFASLPSLPKPCANFCGALLGTNIYVAGGIETPTATTALKTFWKLDLAEKTPRWIELEPWPGPERMLAVAGVQGDSFYLFSGAQLHAGPDGKPVREFLRDAYRFTPGAGWTRLPELPRAAVAAPTPAPNVGDELLILTGDDGTKVDFQPLRGHPGFPRDVLVFSAKRNAWSSRGSVPFSRATVPVVPWLGHFVVPNGEVRPRERTPEVWWAR